MVAYTMQTSCLTYIRGWQQWGSKTYLNLKVLAKLTVAPQERWVVTFLTFGFPTGFEGAVASRSTDIHSSAKAHPWDIALFTTMEIGHGTMLGPFDHPPFTSWCPVNPLLTQPTKDSTSRRMIMDFSWPLPPGLSVN